MTVKTNNVQKGVWWFSNNNNNNNNNITIDGIFSRIGDKDFDDVVYNYIIERRKIKKSFPEIHEITPYDDNDGTFLRKDYTDLKRDIIIADTFSKCALEYEKESGEFLFDNSCQALVQEQVNEDFPLVHRLINYDDFYIRWWFALYSEDKVLDKDTYNYFRNAIIWKVKSFPKFDEMCKIHLGDYSDHCNSIDIAKIYENKTIKDLTTTNYSIKLKQKQLAKRRRGGKKSRKSRNKKRKSNKKKRKTVKKRRLRKQK